MGNFGDRVWTKVARLDNVSNCYDKFCWSSLVVVAIWRTRSRTRLSPRGCKKFHFIDLDYGCSEPFCWCSDGGMGLKAREQRPLGPEAEARLRQQISAWRDELVNMTRRNRLLYFKHTRTSSLEIETPSAFEVAARLTSSGAQTGWRFSFPSDSQDLEIVRPSDSFVRPTPTELVCRGKSAPELRKALGRLDRAARQTYLEKGIWVLYLAVGVLNWIEVEGEPPVESPLVLLPVSLEREGVAAEYRLVRTDDDPLLNPALAVKLDSDFDIRLPAAEELDESNIEEFVSNVEQAVSDRRGWSVTPRAIISTFSFFKEVMYRDILEHEGDLIAHPLIQAVGLGPDAPWRDDLLFEAVQEEHLDRVAPPEKMVSILDADGSQRRCIVAARDGHSFVMDGPPGTGKSQTIANVIAELLRAGKSVLFVSEKSAALDVVNDRLRQAGLGPFLFQLHSKDATRKAVAQELGRALRERPRATSGPMAREQLEQLRRKRESLSDYAAAMNEVRAPLGKSLHDVIGMAAKLHEGPTPPPTSIDPASFSLDDYLRVLESTEVLARAWGPVERGGRFLWKHLSASATPSSMADAARIAEHALRALEELGYLGGSAAEVLARPRPTSVGDIKSLLRLLMLLEKRGAIPTTWLSARDFFWIRSEVGQLRSAWERASETTVAAEEILGEGWRNVQAGTVRQCEDALRLFAALSPPKYVASQVDLGHHHAEAKFLTRAHLGVDRIRSGVESVASAFSIPSDTVTLDRAREVAELAALISEPVRPPAGWFAPGAERQLELAIGELEPLVQEWQSFRAELSPLFKRVVLDADLQALVARFERVHRGLRKLGGEYRVDKRSVAALTVAGRADGQAILALGRAALWQACDRKLTEAAGRYGPLLGEYYAGEDTDFERIRQVLALARRSLDLAGLPRDRGPLAERLSSESAPDPGLVAAGRQLLHDLDELEQTGSGVLRDDFPVVLELPLVQLGSWFAASGSALESVLAASGALSTEVGRNVDPGVLEVALDRLSAAIKADANLQKRVVAGDELLGPLWLGGQTDWVRVEAMLEWAQSVRSSVQGLLSDAAATKMLSAPLGTEELRLGAEKFEGALKGLQSLFEPTYWVELESDVRGSFEDGEQLLSGLVNTTADIEEWWTFTDSLAWLRRAGLDDVASYCVDGKVHRELVRPMVERAVLDGWVRAVLQLDRDRLGPTRAEDRDALVDEFAALDREIISLSSAVIIDACTARRPASLAGSAAIINREAEKQKRHMPIRALLGSTGAISQSLKPCFVMSPLAVSQYLPGDMRFDVVIFDEASQIRPADAINCIYRGNQLIVAGDQKQLPPTDFFQAGDSSDDEYDEGQLDEFTSVLDLCKAAGAFESLPLRWHYRSAHEALVTYSNYRFYQGNLLTFPAAQQDGDSLGVRFRKVDGVYRRGGSRDNPIEAREVIDRVLYHRRHNPAKSLGVVAFSSAQEDAIFAELESRAQSEPELRGIVSDDRLNGYFIKKLESVQGDERDIIIFSIGYGPDENGKFTLQMGPLIQAGGWRRLNVAITRARELVEVVSSIVPEDISLEASSEGVRHLRGYLDFARRGAAALAIDIDASGRDAESPLEEDVLRTIRSWGYEVVPQLGVAGYRLDLAVKHPDKVGWYVLGVECDGAMYHSSKVARDRDRLRQGVLQRLGWKIHRIWGPAWYRDRTNQELRLRDAISRAIEGVAVVAARAEEPRPIALVHDEADFDSPPSWTVPYVKAPVMGVDRSYELHDPGARYELRRLIRHIVAVEQPVHKDLVIRAAREAWGQGRAGSRIRENFDYAVRELVGSVAESDGGFLSTPGYVLTVVRAPLVASDIRPVKHVPPEEIQLAITNAVNDSHAIVIDDLTQHVARIFGWQRRGAEIQSAIDLALDKLVTKGVLSVDATGVVILAR